MDVHIANHCCITMSKAISRHLSQKGSFSLDRFNGRDAQGQKDRQARSRACTWTDLFSVCLTVFLFIIFLHLCSFRFSSSSPFLLLLLLLLLEAILSSTGSVIPSLNGEFKQSWAIHDIHFSPCNLCTQSKSVTDSPTDRRMDQPMDGHIHL